MFNGWGIPKENWSKLPHCFIESLPLVETLAEMKVILYVLRHTWGYQDDEKRISIDEFVNGRKHTKRYCERHPKSPKRIDSGTGMSENAIRNGIERAISHGFIQVYIDDSDKARIKKYYSLSTLGVQELNPAPQELNPGVPRVEPRTKKETIERKKEITPPSGDILTYHMTDETDSEFDCFCGERIIIAQLENANAHCKECMQPIRVFNWIDVVAKKPPQKARRQESGSYNGLAGFDDKPFKAFCVLYGVPYEGLPVKKVRQWANEIKKVADLFDVDSETTYQAIKSIKDSEHSWKSFTSPYVTGFQELLGIMIARVNKEENQNSQDNDKPVGYYDEDWSIDD